MRGRVIAILLAIALGRHALGAPLVGWVGGHLRPRWSLGVGAAAGWSAALVALRYLTTRRVNSEGDKKHQRVASSQ